MMGVRTASCAICNTKTGSTSCIIAVLRLPAGCTEALQVLPLLSHLLWAHIGDCGNSVLAVDPAGLLEGSPAPDCEWAGSSAAAQRSHAQQPRCKSLPAPAAQGTQSSATATQNKVV